MIYRLSPSYFIFSDQIPANFRLEQENESDKQESDSEQDEESDDDDQDNEESDQDDEVKSDEDQGMDDTTNQFDDDADTQLEEPTKTTTGIVQGKGTDAEMTEAQQKNENLETTQEQVVDDAHVTITTVTKKTEVSPLDVPVHHEVPRAQARTFLTIPVFVIPESSPVFTNISQSSHIPTPPSIQTTPIPPPTIETSNPLSNLSDFASVFQFNDRITTLEKEVADLKKDPLHTQVTSLVDSHLDTRLGETREELMNFLSESLTARIKEQTSSQPQSTYEAASNLTEFELKKILIDKMKKSESYLTAPEHGECYDSLKKSYDLDKDFFYSYDAYTLKRSREDNDKDEDPSAGSDRGLKKRKTSKDAEPITGLKTKDSTSSSSKVTKSQPKSSGKSVQSEEPVFEVADSDLPQDQEGNRGDNKGEPRKEIVSKEDWFKKPFLKNPLTLTRILARQHKKDQLKIDILTGLAFKLLKGTRTNYAELEYDFEECYKVVSEKLDWVNPEGDDYPFDLSKPLPLVISGRRQRILVDYFINNDLKYLQGGASTMTYMIFQALKTWFQTYGVQLKLLMIYMCYRVYHIGENNVRPSMRMQEENNQEEMYTLRSIFWQSLMLR
ncbi:hypothetical protein Tco_0168324 [Tanacetum coccineum]